METFELAAAEQLDRDLASDGPERLDAILFLFRIGLLGPDVEARLGRALTDEEQDHVLANFWKA
jgi:hypothetical protein